MPSARAAEEEALERFGRNLGIAFQLIDDMLDFSARQSELGKSVGDDFRDGKITLPILIAFARGDAEERAFWRRTLEDCDQDRAIWTRYATVRASRRTGGDAASGPAYAAEAAAALAGFPGREVAPRPDRSRRVRHRARILIRGPRIRRHDLRLRRARRLAYIQRPVGGV